MKTPIVITCLLVVELASSGELKKSLSGSMPKRFSCTPQTQLKLKDGGIKDVNLAPLIVYAESSQSAALLALNQYTLFL